MKRINITRLFSTLTVILPLGAVLVGLAHGQPPTQDLLGHWKGDAGVVLSEVDGFVDFWEDQSGNGLDARREDEVFSRMPHIEKSSVTFGNGTHDTIHFIKDGWLTLFNTETDTGDNPLSVPDVQIFAVVEQRNDITLDRREYFSNYSNAINWGYGYSVDLGVEGPPEALDQPS